MMLDVAVAVAVVVLDRQTKKAVVPEYTREELPNSLVELQVTVSVNQQTSNQRPTGLGGDAVTERSEPTGIIKALQCQKRRNNTNKQRETRTLRLYRMIESETCISLDLGWAWRHDQGFHLLFDPVPTPKQAPLGMHAV